MSLVAEGEHERQDFKFAISDARKIARSVSAFANTAGGRLLVGVKDNGELAGVRNEEDIYVVEQAARRYCSPEVEVEFTAFRVDERKIIIRVSIPQVASRPVYCLEDDGRRRAYCRVADENIVAHPLMVRAWRSDAPASFALDATSSSLLALLDANPAGVDVPEVAIALKISQCRAESLIVNMVGAGIVGFVYHAPKFLIARL